MQNYSKRWGVTLRAQPPRTSCKLPQTRALTPKRQIGSEPQGPLPKSEGPDSKSPRNCGPKSFPLDQEQGIQFYFNSLCTHFPSLEFPCPLRSFRTLPPPPGINRSQEKAQITPRRFFTTCPARHRERFVLFCFALFCFAAATKNEFKNRIFSNEKLRLAGWWKAELEGAQIHWFGW